MQFAVPVARTIMCILDNLSEHGFWFENEILLRYHATTDCKYSSKQAKVEQDGAILRDFKSEEKLRIDQGD
jgi:hypothetical protein